MKPDRFDPNLFQSKPRTRVVRVEIVVKADGHARKCSRIRSIQARRRAKS